MKCPKCGEEMEEGYIWELSRYLYGYWRLFWSKEIPSLGLFERLPKDKIELFKEKGIHDLEKGLRCANCKLILFSYEEKIRPEVKLPKTPEELYERLLDVYMLIHGSGSKQLLENKIKFLIKKGLSREEAIYNLADKEKIERVKDSDVLTVD